MIDQAKGVLIERFRLMPDQAFHRLAEASMHTHRKVRDIADQLLHTGELPVVAPRADSPRPRPRARPMPDRPGREAPQDS